MTTMLDIFLKDLGDEGKHGGSHCKAPEMALQMRAILDGTQGAKDTCAYTALMSDLAYIYGTRFAKRGVSLEDFLESVTHSITKNVREVQLAALIERLCHPHHGGAQLM